MEAPAWAEQLGFDMVAVSSEEPGCSPSEIVAPSGPASQGWQSARWVLRQPSASGVADKGVPFEGRINRLQSDVASAQRHMSMFRQDATCPDVPLALYEPPLYY